jgi:DNA-directed RNA polymerase specialized sigma subunit
MSAGATELLKARFYLGVTRRDAAEILGISQAEVERFFKEIQRKIPHLKKNLT